MTRQYIQRNYSLDLLKIVSMFMIVLLHSGSHGGTLAICEGINFYTIIFHFIESLTICSVDVFVLISGYFLCVQKFRPSRILRIAIIVLFYSISWMLISLYVFNEQFTTMDFLKTFFPISYSQYWFISSYIGMYILSPILNNMIMNTNRTQHIGIILLLVMVFCLWPDIIPYSNPLGITSGGYTLIWFVVLYIIAAYFRKYPVLLNPIKALSLYLMSAFALLLIWLITAIATSAENFENEVYGMATFYYYRYNSFFVLLSSIFFWLLFLNLKIYNLIIIKGIRFIAPLTIGVYLIHENNRARVFVWQGLQGMEVSLLAPVVVIGYSLFIYLSCLVVEKIRSLIFSVINKGCWYQTKLEQIDTIPNLVYQYIRCHF